MKYQNYMSKIKNKFLTILRGKPEISQTREVMTGPNREVKAEKLIMESLSCPYCLSKNFQKRGFRKKKLEKVQLYLCLDCGKTFTPYSTKGKHYPLSVMLDAISIYNLGYSLEETCRIVKERQQKTRPAASSLTDAHSREASLGLSEDSISTDKNFVKSPNSVYTFMIQPSTVSNWLSETTDLCRFARMREYAMKKFSPKEMVITATLAHRQLYRYRFHQAKCSLMIKEEYQHRKFTPLQEFLEMVPVECPHQYFQEGLRASEAQLTFSKTQMIVRAKQNYATKLATFVLQSVKERKGRHEAIQKFMLANDSVTVATEVPVYITRDDIEHMKSQLGFEIYKKSAGTASEDKEISAADGLPRLITGHIDILQIRNGQIHILDYKPRAEKERPIEQLTLYAMALSRLTGLRLYEFKCAWFDEKDYFEFYPLHVLHKLKKTKRRKIVTDEGVYKINQDRKKILSVRPINI